MIHSPLSVFKWFLYAKSNIVKDIIIVVYDEYKYAGAGGLGG